MKTIYMILTHSLARTGLRICLSADASLRLLGDSGDPKAGWAEAARIAPDVLLVDDLTLASIRNSDANLSASTLSSKTNLALFTAPSSMNEVDAALRVGVRGFIDSSATPEALISALRRISDGERFVSPSLLPHLPDSDIDLQTRGIIPEDRLSAREMEVFALTSEGLEAKEIGDRLGISPRTVDVHRASMRQKLGLTGVHELIRFAVNWSRDRQRTQRLSRFCHETSPLLLIEDDEVDVLSVERALAGLKSRFPIQTMRNGEEALAWLRNPESTRPFLIVLDINMPRMNGHDFLLELRKDPSLRSIPVLVMTTSTIESDRARMYDAGIAGFIVKPTRSEEFSQIFRTLAEFWGITTPPPSPRDGTSTATNSRLATQVCE